MADGLIARIGHWCFRHKWGVLAIWLVAMIGGVLSAGPVFSALDSSNGPPSLESVRADNVLTEGRNTGGTLVGVLSGVDPQASAVRTAVHDTAGGLTAISGVTSVATPFDSGLPAAQAASMIAKNGHGLLIQVSLADLDGDPRKTAEDAVSDRLHALGGSLLRAGQPAATVQVGGGSLINRQATQQAETDLTRAEELSLPITLIILVFVFGGIIAAGLPVLTAIVSVASAMTLLLVFSKFTTLDQNVVTVVTLLGLGLSVDYGLLLVARYREELGGGATPDEAVSRAWATAGRTIMFSALTVAAALSGLLMFGLAGLSALGAAGVSIALVAMLSSLTVTAALLGMAKRRIRPSKRAAARIARYGDAAEVGFFARLARLVQRRPLVTALATAAALIAVGVPMLATTVHMDDLNSLPRTLESVRVVDVLTDQFGKAPAPAVTVVARTDPGTLDRWAQRFAGTAGVTRVYPAESVGPDLSTVDIDAAGDPEGQIAKDLVHRVRADRPAAQSWVTGDAAVLTDVLGLILHRLPWALGVTVLAMALLLFAMTGSVVVPAKAILMNVLSLGATFGLMNLVFQRGFLASTLHVTVVHGMNPFTIVSVFAFAFGLSMDYEVFLLARIKEYTDHGLANDVAVRRGLQTSGRIITSAALLMVIVFSCFVTGRMGTVQQIGLGLAVAVAIDATIVRCVLVPATMTLLGRWNWWAPPALRRVHRRIGLGERALPAVPAPEPEPALR